MPPSVSGKGKADENKTNKIIQLEGREAVEINSYILKQCFGLLIYSWKQQNEDCSSIVKFSKFWQHHNLVAQANRND